MNPSVLRRCTVLSSSILAFFTAVSVSTQAQVLWTVGLDDNGWPFTAANPGDGGGANATFVQETGTNPLPGDPFSPEADQQADDDYYFAGVYNTAIAGNGDYIPYGVVDFDEEAQERAFAGSDNDKRFHFNLPATLTPTNLLSVTFDFNNLDTSAANTDPRYGVEVYVNGVLVQEEILVRGAQLDIDYTTAPFTLESVGAEAGPGFDNIVHLRGINYGGDGGGQWMGIDYVQLNQVTEIIPPAVFPWGVGQDDNVHITAGDGGGTNTSFVQEDGATNALPGNPASPEVNQQADDDYYFAGLYTNVITANGVYEPVGLVSVNEEAAERAFAGEDTELRYHFNLPNTVAPDDNLSVSFQALDLDTDAANTDPRWGVEVWVNGVQVQPEVLIRPAQLNQTITTPSFTLASVDVRAGPGHDNIVTLRGISYNDEGGGNWMGIDFVQLNEVLDPIPAPTLPVAIGLNDNQHPNLNGGGPNATFVQEDGATNALPGNPASPETNQEADDDYYLAGVYSTVIPSNGTYTPVGEVHENEEAAERAFAGVDNFLRYHFNLPATMDADDQLSVSFDALSLDESGGAAQYGVEVYFNNVLVLPEVIITPTELGTTFSTPAFTLGSVNAQGGQGFDNIVTLKGINYSAEGGGNWLGIDYVQINPVLPPPFPWSVGRDDNQQGITTVNGGGPNTSFVQENGSVNLLPGNPANAEAHQQSDNDYYFAGEYTTTIPGVVFEAGDYEPVGLVLVNEESAERAFAGSDNDLRYHFNLPATLQPTDELMVSFDAFSLHGSDFLDPNIYDPRWGVEVWVNGVQIMTEEIIRPENIDQDYATRPFTLEEVGAVTGPGGDNIVSLRGISYNFDGGGNWMGIDYVSLDAMPVPVFPWSVGSDDDTHITAGDGGGPNTSFVQEDGTINELPGNPRNLEVNQQSDNDYYFAGIYTNITDQTLFYDPVGIVARNEESAERAFAGNDNDLRYHFNLPSTLSLTQQVSITFDALNLQTVDVAAGVTSPQYGIEVYFNGQIVQEEIVITTNELGVAYTTEPFTLASVNAQLGLGHDNIVSLRGINYMADGGGNWMGIDYVRLNSGTDSGEEPVFTSTVLNDNGSITLNWTGSGALESAPSVLGPWSPVTPAPTATFTENIVPGQNRFYRIRR